MGASIKRGGGSGGRRGRRAKHAPMSEINVTPFVDVMLVLLIIFMVTAPMMVNGVPLDLPQAKAKQLETQNKEPLIVSISKDGKIYIGEQEKDSLTLETLVDKLKAVAAARGSTEEAVFVRGANLAEYGFVTKVLARISEAGFRKLSLVTEAAGG